MTQRVADVTGRSVLEIATRTENEIETGIVTENVTQTDSETESETESETGTEAGRMIIEEEATTVFLRGSSKMAHETSACIATGSTMTEIEIDRGGLRTEARTRHQARHRARGRIEVET